MSLIQFWKVCQPESEVHYINCRGSVDPSEWDDEIHPTSEGFKVSRRDLKMNCVIYRHLQTIHEPHLIAPQVLKFQRT